MRFSVVLVTILCCVLTAFAQDVVTPPPVVPLPGDAPPSPDLSTPSQTILDGGPKRGTPDQPNNGMMGGVMSGMGGGGMGAPGYSATWYPSRGIGASGENLSLVRQNLSAMAPLWMEGPNKLLFSFRVNNTLFQTNAVFPDSGRSFPASLWNINLGLNYIRKFDNGWMAGAMFGFGSASDKPFHSIHEMNLSFLGFLVVPAQRDGDFWRFSLMYSPVGVLNFPIPGIAYQWNPSDRLSVDIGLPLTVTWRPTDEWTISMMYIPLTNVNARTTYRLTQHLQVYAAFEWLNEGYFLADRVNNADRFLGLEKRLVSGVTYNPVEHWYVDLNAGYAFDREYGIGQRQGTNLQNGITVQPGAFLGTSVRFRF